MTFLKQRVPSIVGLVLCIAFLAGGTRAEAATGLTIQPVKIDETIKQGDSLTGEIKLTNASDGPVDVSVSVQDFIPTAGADAIQFVGRAEGVTSVRDWITIAGKSDFELSEAESVIIPYTITAPSNAEPGGHFGVVLFKATPQGGTEGSLKVGTQVGMLVLITIPGSHLEKGRILDFTAPAFQQHGPVPFRVTFENTGTVHFEPKGSIVITNLFGVKVAEVPVTGQVVLPTSVRTLNFAWNGGAFSVGRYTANATLYDGEGTALTTKTIHFWIIPIWYALLFMILLGGIYGIIRYTKRHVRLTLVK